MPTRAIPPRHKDTPSSPWHYEQEGFEKPIVGDSKPLLIQAIIDFRIANQLPIGNPEEDYEDFARRKWPERYYSASGENQTFPPVEKARTPLDEIGVKNKLWTKRWTMKEKPKLVSRDEADARASICANCPANVMVQEITICSPCIKEINRNAVLLSGNRMHPGLKICNALQHDNRVAVWMPDELLERSRKFLATAPAQCWLRDKRFPLMTEVPDMTDTDVQKDFEQAPVPIIEHVLATHREPSLDPNPLRERQSIGPDEVGEMPSL